MDESIDDLMVDGVVCQPNYEPWTTEALLDHGIEHTPIREWFSSQEIELDDVDEESIHQYYFSLEESGVLGQLSRHLAEEVFYLTFLNRDLLRRLHEQIAFRLSEIHPGQAEKESAFFRRPGMLKRVPPPQWARRAVFHRDRGMCSFCHRDVSGLVSPEAREAYDHIVPLARGGSNEVTNLQLLCRVCNGEKGAREPEAGSAYQRWYPPAEPAAARPSTASR